MHRRRDFSILAFLLDKEWPLAKNLLIENAPALFQLYLRADLLFVPKHNLHLNKVLLF